MRGAAAAALLFVAAAGLSALTMLHGIQPNDEGLMLQAAARIADGQVPYGDFWWYYPPGQPYLIAGLWELFGPSLVAWRVLRVLADATIALLVFVLARRRAPLGLALLASAGAALAMAFPSGPHPFPISLALALGALLAFERRPLAAGALAGLCAFWRLEFAAYLGLAIVVALLLRDGRAGLGPVLRFAGTALLVAAVLYAPVVAAAGAGDSWDLLVDYPLTDFGDYQSLPFPLDYDRPLRLDYVLHFYLPLALVLGLIGAVGTLALTARGRVDAPLVATVVFSAGTAHYLLVRPDVFHTAPLAVCVSVLAAWALARARPRGRRSANRRRLPALAATALAALGLAWLVADGLAHRVRGLTEDTARLRLDFADGVSARPAEVRDLARAVHELRRRVPPGEPIYVATRRSDRVTSGHPLLYVLARRPNPTRYDIQAPGVVTSAPVQREIVSELERAQPRVVIRWTAAVTAAPEPNRAGRERGARLLDAYLRQAYRPSAVIGSFVVLRRRSG